LRGTSYPGLTFNKHFNRKAVAAIQFSHIVHIIGQNPVGVVSDLPRSPNVAPKAFEATLGWRPIPRWGILNGAMPQSLSAVYIHLVFSTKDRRPLLRDKPTRDALHSYLGGISKQLDCPPILVGGVEDHIHLLARLGRTITQAEWVKELKRVSNLWLKERGRDYADFEWQGGYADFSVSQSNLEPVKQYIAGQEEHHRKVGFQDELRALLRRHKIEWDEKYVWD
jgi:REP element-mobilizing transposase RayT